MGLNFLLKNNNYYIELIPEWVREECFVFQTYYPNVSEYYNQSIINKGT